MDLRLINAYAVCRSITRAAARNFYYGFLVLPREKRNAFCAVYAFMRHADDISDDPSIPAADRHQKLADWLGSWHRVLGGANTDDPILLALADTQRHYQISPDLFDQLVAGTAMDLEQMLQREAAQHYPPAADHLLKRDDSLETVRAVMAYEEAAGQGLAPSPAAAGALQGISSAPHHWMVAAPQWELTFPTFNDLYSYCYHVASVVGLISIRIYGYRDPAAEKLAEHTGVAFQLTNIIRDVKEDARLNRIYIPIEDLMRLDVTPDIFEFLRAPAGELTQAVRQTDPLAPHPIAARLRPAVELLAARAREYYRSADQLLPLLDLDSQPAFWTLVTIYRSLLDKIAATGFDVVGERKVALTTAQKLKILGKGFVRRLV